MTNCASLTDGCAVANANRCSMRLPIWCSGRVRRLPRLLRQRVLRALLHSLWQMRSIPMLRRYLHRLFHKRTHLYHPSLRIP